MEGGGAVQGRGSVGFFGVGVDSEVAAGGVAEEEAAGKRGESACCG